MAHYVAMVVCMSDKAIHRKIFKWEPFQYICEDWDGNETIVGGVFPQDVRDGCESNIRTIHGPIVTGFWSWTMYQFVQGGNI
jgi:hypothetical protein